MGGHTFVGDETETEVAQSFIDLIYKTQDGYISVAAMHDKHWEALSKALDRPDFLTDPRFTTPELREIHKEERLNLTQQGLAPHTTAHLMEILEAHDVPCAPILTRTEMRDHPQIVANDILVYTDHPQAGPLRQARQPAVFSKTQNEMRRPAPVLGADTRDVLGEAGLTEAEIETLIESRAAHQAEEVGS